MSSGDTRKGFTQANFNSDAFGIVAAEILLISVLVGYWMSSWYVFGGILVGMIIALMIPVINILMLIVMSILWSFVAGILMLAFYYDLDIENNSFSNITSISDIFSYPGCVVVAGLVFVMSVGVHLGSIEYGKDLTDDKDRNI